MTGVAMVGAAETTELGVIPNLSELQLHADAALNAFADAGLNARDIDGFATAGFRPTEVAQYLGLRPRWVDGTSVGGCSFMVHVRHAVAAIQAGHCSTVLITHGESGRSRVGKSGFAPAPASFGGQFEAPFGVVGTWGTRPARGHGGGVGAPARPGPTWAKWRPRRRPRSRWWRLACPCALVQRHA